MKSLDKILKPFSKMQKELREFVTANTKKMTANDNKVASLRAENVELGDSNVKAEATIQKIGEILGD